MRLTKSTWTAQQLPQARVDRLHRAQGGYNEHAYNGCEDIEGAFRLSHWHLVDTFVYFSHRLVTAPPRQWTTVAHRHGVQARGRGECPSSLPRGEHQPHRIARSRCSCLISNRGETTDSNKTRTAMETSKEVGCSGSARRHSSAEQVRLPQLSTVCTWIRACHICTAAKSIHEG